MGEYRPSLTESGLIYNFSTLQGCKNGILSVETVLAILNFDSFPGLAMNSTILSEDGGPLSGPMSELQVPDSPGVTGGNRHDTEHSVAEPG
jgi:hypothetical protein